MLRCTTNAIRLCFILHEMRTFSIVNDLFRSAMNLYLSCACINPAWCATITKNYKSKNKFWTFCARLDPLGSTLFVLEWTHLCDWMILSESYFWGRWWRVSLRYIKYTIIYSMILTTPYAFFLLFSFFSFAAAKMKLTSCCHLSLLLLLVVKGEYILSYFYF